MKGRRALRWVLIGAGALLIVLLTIVAIVVLPILGHEDQGASTQQDSGEDWPTVVVAHGDDGRDRALAVIGEDGQAVDTSALRPGQRIVVSGSGYDGSRGIYVALCVLPDSPQERPGPCIGGVPSAGADGDAAEAEPGAVEWAPSNWINDDWAWRLFGARSWDDRDAGTFTAYLVVGDPIGEGFDCREQACGIVTRNDHTAAGDRVQDLRIPIAFAD